MGLAIHFFPASQRSVAPPSGVIRHHHWDETVLHRAFREAARQTSIVKSVRPHTFRNSFATHPLQSGYNIRAVQELLSHKDSKTIILYTHILNRGGLAVKYPLD